MSQKTDEKTEQAAERYVIPATFSRLIIEKSRRVQRLEAEVREQTEAWQEHLEVPEGYEPKIGDDRESVAFVPKLSPAAPQAKPKRAPKTSKAAG